jgi:hypothetical protein
LQVANLPARPYVSCPLHGYWKSIYETPTCISTDILDVFLHYGSMFFSGLDIHQETISVDDLWNHPFYAESCGRYNEGL